MPSLQATKRRIKSVEATKKITKAMKLVASAKLKKAKENFEVNKELSSSLIPNMAQALYDCAKSCGAENYIKEADINKSTLYLVIASDMGLCGGYNTNVAKFAINDSKPSDIFILIGKKTLSQFKAKSMNVANIYLNNPNSTDFYSMYYVAKEITTHFESGKIGSVKLVYTKFINSVTFEPKISNLLPISSDESRILYEPESNPQYLLNGLLRDFLSTCLHTAIIESRVCEHAASRMAMENATDNATEIQDKLLLEYNSARQALITQEIAEIVGGANAI